LYHREEHRGFELVNTADSQLYEAFVEKLDQGLDVIQYFDPLLFRRIGRSVKRFIFVPGGGDHYSPVLEAHMMDVATLVQQTNLYTALLIIHEATHARLERCGISMTQSNAARVERLCVDAQVAFARRVPGGEEVAQQLLRTLETPWWGPDEARSRIIRRLGLAGWPKWLITLLTVPEQLRGWYRTIRPGR
jgi:hypothetical protein